MLSVWEDKGERQHVNSRELAVERDSGLKDVV